jgi:serine protease inhibitor
MNPQALKRWQRLFWWGAAVLCAGGLVWLVVDRLGDGPVPYTPGPAVTKVVDSNTTLALDLYQKLRTRSGNVFFSPFSVVTGLGLAYAGARGNTESEIGRAAHFELAPGELHAALGELIARMDRLQHGRRLTLVTANRLWCQQGHAFSNTFLDLAHRDYRAELEVADFEHAAGAARSRINAWVAQCTRGKIPGLLEAGQIDPATRLALCNVLYFKGDWSSQFDEKKTRPRPFFLTTKDTISVPMMLNDCRLKLARVEDPAVTLLEMPYYGGDLAMVIVLPREVEGLAAVENALTAEKLNEWLLYLHAASPQQLLVNLPRFTTRQGVDLIPVLRSLGIISAFDRTADFSGMDGTMNLFLAAAIHRAFVEVSETGTEAAAVTHLGTEAAASPESFDADHPFLFLIRDRGSGTILFLGRLADPRS